MLLAMTDLILPSRRRFLGLAAGLICAPAVVQYANLMPVQVFETFGPNGLLTVEMITQELSRVMSLQGANKLSSLLTVRGQKQSYISMNYNKHDRTMSLEQYSTRFLEPAAGNLMRSAGGASFGTEPLPLPRGVWEAAASTRGIAVRTVSDYDIMTDSVFTRFDVTHN